MLSNSPLSLRRPVLGGAVLVLAGLLHAQAGEAAAGKVDFNRDVQPILS